GPNWHGTGRSPERPRCPGMGLRSRMGRSQGPWRSDRGISGGHSARPDTGLRAKEPRGACGGKTPRVAASQRSSLRFWHAAAAPVRLAPSPRPLDAESGCVKVRAHGYNTFTVFNIFLSESDTTSIPGGDTPVQAHQVSSPGSHPITPEPAPQRLAPLEPLPS